MILSPKSLEDSTVLRPGDLIVLDLDFTLVDWGTPFDKFHNRKYGTHLTIESWTHYNLRDILPGITEEEELSRIADFCRSPYFRRIKPIEGAVEAVKTLSKDYRLAIVTFRPRAVKRETCRLVNRNFKPISEIYFAREDHGGDSRKKAEICREIGAKLAIEDNLTHAIEYYFAGFQVILFGDYPWNQGTLPRFMKRAGTWNEVLEKI